MASVPFDQLDGEIWFNGAFVPWKDAKIHVLTHGLHYASAVFEGERAYGGQVFKLTEHNQRLHKSADILGFKIPYSVAELDAATIELLKRQGFSEAYVRPIAWRGSEMMGVSAQNNRINVAIAIWQWGSRATWSSAAGRSASGCSIGREARTSRTGTSATAPAICSTSSAESGSSQWQSSSTITRGSRAARARR